MYRSADKAATFNRLDAAIGVAGGIEPIMGYRSQSISIDAADHRIVCAA